MSEGQRLQDMVAQIPNGALTVPAGREKRVRKSMYELMGVNGLEMQWDRVRSMACRIVLNRRDRRSTDGGRLAALKDEQNLGSSLAALAALTQLHVSG